MSELADDGSMAGNKKMPPSNGYNNKEVFLRELQKTIHFVKTLTSSNLPNFSGNCMMKFPVWFVKKHGDKFQRTVFLRSGVSSKPWLVQLSVCARPSKSTEVKLSSGWREFAVFNGLLEGDDLLFCLSELSIFDVYIFRETKKPNQPSSFQAPRKLSHDFDNSQEEVLQKSGGCRDRHLSAERSEGSVDGLSGLFIKKKRVGEEGPIFAFHGRSKAGGRYSQSNFNWHYLQSRNLRDPSSLRCDSHQGQEPPDREHEELEKPCTGDRWAKHNIGARKRNVNEDEDMDVEETLQLPPSFVKQLKASNFHNGRRAARLEIPKDFVRTHGSELHPPMVKLQGIQERSPARIVVCKWWKTGGESAPSRLYLSDGWREFGDENGLKVGQELMFTLTADSFLVVRANSGTPCCVVSQCAVE